MGGIVESPGGEVAEDFGDGGEDEAEGGGVGWEAEVVVG